MKERRRTKMVGEARGRDCESFAGDGTRDVAKYVW
jgi:hypothetical protein